MTRQEIIEGNKLIHEFKFPLSYTDGKKSMNNNYLKTKKLKYHCSWDWLMPVVEKIEGMNIEINNVITSVDITIVYGGCIIKDKDNLGLVDIYKHSTDSSNKLESTYEAVVEFIKWHNKQEKK